MAEGSLFILKDCFIHLLIQHPRYVSLSLPRLKLKLEEIDQNIMLEM